LLALAGGVVVLRADVDPAVVDRLAVLVGLGLDREHAADDERAGDGRRDDLLGLEADAHEVGGEVRGGGTGRDGDVLGEPGQRDVRHGQYPFPVVPNWREKRMSPSTMSCMSAMPWRSMSARSVPTPKAKPVYSSGSMPAATSTWGLTMPQPPHSIQPAPPFFWGNHRSISALGSVNGKKLGRSRVRA